MHHGSLSQRGPLAMLVIWLAILVLDSVWLKSSNGRWWQWNLATLMLDICYGLTLIPKGQAVIASNRIGANAVSEIYSLINGA